MSLTIYVAHSGQKVQADATRISTLEALRACVTNAASIAGNRQVFLTSKGKQVRPQNLLTENEIYVFDSSLLSPQSADTPKKPLSLAPESSSYDAGYPPDSIINQNDLQSWKTLFQERLQWATKLRKECAALATEAQQRNEEQVVIERSLNVAVISLQSHTKSAEQKHAGAEEWADELLKEQEAHIDNWEKDLERLAHIPARAELAIFVQAHNAPAPSASRGLGETILQDFVDVEQVNKAAASAQSIMTKFAQRVVDLRTSLTGAVAQSQDLMTAVEQMQNASSTATDEEPAKVMEEIDIIVDKMTKDLAHVDSLPTNAQGVSRASKMALLHTRNYLPNLIELCGEVNNLLHRSVQQRNAAAEASMHHMQTLAVIESTLSQAYTAIKSLDMSPDDQQSFNTLNLLSRLPYAYGSLLIEAVRRREWVDKMKKDSSTLAEELATYQEEEERRRKKWLNSIDDVVRPEMVKGNALGVEVNLQADDTEWPVVERQDLHDYVHSLTSLDLPAAVIDDLVQAIKELDRPTKKQIKHAKTFKNGSVHEAAFGTTSLMLRGEDEYKVLKDTNAKLEEDLKGQKSRVRKLEDLLHRQANVNRTVSGDVFRPQIELMSDVTTPPLTSPRPDDMIRHGSIGSRRPSSSLAGEEKKMARRIVMLEAELQSAKEHGASLEKDAQAKQQADADGRRQIEEAVSTKKDIMENMEAQQREFANERRTLERELGEARSKIEEIEDEMYRLLGSRDQERSGIKAHEQEFERLKKDASEQQNSMQKQLEDAQNALQNQQDENSRLSDALGDSDRARKTAEEIAQKSKDEVAEQHETSARQVDLLAAAHRHLSPATEPPEKYADLVQILENLARRSAAHVRDLADAVTIAKSENGSLQSQHEATTKELNSVSSKHAVAEAEIIRLNDEMDSEKAHTRSLRSCLEDEREQLRTLRSKFADGETGSDVLRQRITEAEAKILRLTEQLGEEKSHNNSLDFELMRVQTKLNNVQTAANATDTRLGQRGSRAKELSQKLFAQNARLLRLLETLGFAVSYKDNTMVVERASKVGASTMLTDPYASMNRTVSLTSPPPTRKTSLSNDEPSPTTYLHWPDSTSAEEEDIQFTAFSQHLSLFNTDAFADAIAKRLRDFEYTARKWQKEARSYKERTTRLLSDSAAKIAVRDFKEGDLALFLPTKGKHMGAWAAFNINAPHHFLREKEGMNLARREWLVARISKVEERVVDLSKPPAPSNSSMRSIGSTSVDAASLDENDNPFELSDGLTWYLVHAAEDKSGAPSTPGLAKSTVASTTVDAKGSIRIKKGKVAGEAEKMLGKSLDSRRSSSNSKLGVPAGWMGGAVRAGSVASAEEVTGLSKKASVKGLGILRDEQEQEQTNLDFAPKSYDDGVFPLPMESSPHKKAVTISPVRTQKAPDTSPTKLQQPPDTISPTKSQQISPAKAARLRSTSPSKSIRSLARHLEAAEASSSTSPQKAKVSPAKSLRESQVVAQSSPRKAVSHSQLRDGAQGSIDREGREGDEGEDGDRRERKGWRSLFSGEWEQKL